MTDLQLIEKYKSWDIEAFGEIYEKYVDQIYKFVYLKVSNKQIAEDIVSEGFMKCLNSLENFVPKSESSLKSWIYTVMYNLVKDYYRTKKEDIDIDEVFSLWLEEHFWDDLDNKEQLKQVVEFLKSIKPEQSEILVMRIWNDLSYKEIAEITWKSTDNCKQIVSRVLKNINANLAVFLILMMI